MSMQSQISRILESDLSRQINDSLKHNQDEIKNLERLLVDKNKHVHTLNTKLRQQLQFINTVINKNIILESCCRLMKKQFDNIKKDVSFMKKQFQQIINNNQTILIQSFNLSLLSFNKQHHTTSTQKYDKQVEVNFKSKQQIQYQRTIQQHKYTIYNLQIANQQLQNKLNNLKIVCSQQSLSSHRSIHNQLQIRQFIKNILSSKINLLESKYCGDIIQGMKNGNGICQYQNGYVYQGNFKNNKRCGLGCLKNGDIEIYRGYWNNDQFEGRGSLDKMYLENVISFSGIFKEGKIDGFGTKTYVNGRRMLGKWKGQICQGQALLIDQEGKKFIGTYNGSCFIKSSGESIQL